jgi:iron(III) transport system permease protein
MKELPATLLLRPVGFDTLAVRVWLEASEEYFQLAAPAALLIVIMTVPALLLLVAKDWRAA